MMRTWVWPALLCAAATGEACGGDDNTNAPGPDASVPDVVEAAATDTSTPHPVDGAIVDASVEADAGIDAPGDADAMPYPAPHPDMPQVLDPTKGPVLTKPRIVPVVYAGDPLAPSIQQFIGQLAGSMYWTAATSEYGVGPLSVAPTVTITDPAPATITDAQIAAWLTANLDAALGAADGGTPDGGSDAGPNEGGAGDGGAPWPAPDGNTLYAVFYPDGTSVEIPGTPGVPIWVSCTNFGAYHESVAYQGGTATYAVMPRCASYLGHGGLEEATLGFSHEAIEAATDPFGTAFNSTNVAGLGWSTVSGGGEVGDLCKLEPSSDTMPPGIGFLAQRTWSNASASAGHDPCAPVPAGAAYFNALPEWSPAQMYAGYYVSGVPVPPGTSATVAVHLFSDGPTSGPWTLSAGEPNVPQLPPDPLNQLSFSFDKTQGQNGDVVHLTITRKPLAQGETPMGLPFQIKSTLGTTSHSSWGIAGF